MERENLKKDNLTNEKFSKKFINQFDLVNYAIRLADNMIKSGRGPRVKVEVDNPVVQILAEIDQGKDYLEEIVEIVQIQHEKDESAVKFETGSKEKFKSLMPSKSEKKKSRILQ